MMVNCAFVCARIPCMLLHHGSVPSPLNTASRVYLHALTKTPPKAYSTAFALFDPPHCIFLEGLKSKAEITAKNEYE